MEALHAVITHNVASLRAAPDSDSEQVSQAILGDNVLLLEERGGYAHVRTPDEDEGWVWRRHLRPYDPTIPFERQAWPFGERPDDACYVIADFEDLCAEPGEPGTLITKLVFGTWVRKVVQVEAYFGPAYQVVVPGGALAGEEKWMTGYVTEEAVLPAGTNGYTTEFSGELAVILATRFVGTPYLWGGTTPFGFDCSGFVQRIYSMLNITLPRDAYRQAASPLGASVPEGEKREAGDLVFFCGQSDPRNRGITHVGMALNDARFIHAVGKEGVIITPFDDPYYAGLYTCKGTWRYRG
jgi:cell wall-associated NlpC family hydrolase